MATKKKVSKPKMIHSPLLNLRSPIQDQIKKIRILKNILPPDNRWGGGKWDHLIIKLEQGDCIELGKKEAASFANRARNIGYTIMLRKHNDTLVRIWFEGLNPKHKLNK